MQKKKSNKQPMSVLGKLREQQGYRLLECLTARLGFLFVESKHARCHSRCFSWMALEVQHIVLGWQKRYSVRA
jgi:hypothetical protein